MDCIVLCGGLGTRLRPVLKNTPKALASISGKPFLYLLFYQLYRFKLISRVILATGYQAEKIQNFCHNLPFDFSINFSHEETPLGTGGAIAKALEKTTTDNVLILNGDCYCNYNLSDMLNQHISTNATISMLCTRVDDTKRFGQIQFDENSKQITAFTEKSQISKPGWINAGIYIIKKSKFEELNSASHFSIENDVFPNYVNAGLYAYKHTGFFTDIGTESSFKEAQQSLLYFFEQTESIQENNKELSKT